MRIFSFGRILSIGFIAGVLGLFSISAVAIWQQYQTIYITEELYEHSFTVTNTVRELRADVGFIWELVIKATYQDIYSDDMLIQVSNLEEKIEKELTIVRNSYLGDPADIGDIEEYYKELINHVHETITVRNTIDAKSAVRFLEDNNIEHFYYSLSEDVERVLKFAIDDAGKFKKQATDEVNKGVERLIVIFSIILIIGLVGSTIVFRYARKEFNKIAAAVESIKHDNFQKMTIGKNELLEFINLKEVINKMVDDITVSRKKIKEQKDEALIRNEMLVEQTRNLEEINAELDASYEEANKINSILETEQKRYKALMEFASDGVHVLDIDGNIVEFSESFALMLGYDNEETARLNVSDWDATLSLENIIREIHSSLNSSSVLETKYRRKDGSIIDVEINAKGITLDGKEYLYASARDITEKKEQESLRKLLLSSLGDGVYGIDINGKCTFVNDAALQMLGFEISEILGFAQHQLFHHHHKDGELYLETECPVFQTLLDGVTREAEEYFIKKNGEYFDVHLKVAPILISDQIVGAVAVFQDVTERKLLEENLRSINKHLNNLVKEEIDKRLEKEKLLVQQSKMAMMGEMIGAIAHQWRQPLNSLSVTIQDVPIAYQFGELDAEYLARYKQEAMHIIQSMSSTIDDFKNFFSTNKTQEEFYIEDAINDVLKILSSQLKLNGIEIIFNTNESNKHKYMCYKNELKQVLLNILANAKDALLENKIDKPFIKIEVSQSDKESTISIEDSAGGISDTVIDRIFEPYFTTKSEEKGTGIGLYMSKEIVEEHLGGKLSVENTENGAKFTVSHLSGSQHY